MYNYNSKLKNKTDAAITFFFLATELQQKELFSAAISPYYQPLTFTFKHHFFIYMQIKYILLYSLLLFLKWVLVRSYIHVITTNKLITLLTRKNCLHNQIEPDINYTEEKIYHPYLERIVKHFPNLLTRNIDF